MLLLLMMMYVYSGGPQIPKFNTYLKIPENHQNVTPLLTRKPAVQELHAGHIAQPVPE